MEIGKRFANLEKIGNLEKRLEIWKEIENLENIWKFEKINLKIWKKMEIWKKVESFEKIWQFRNFTKKIEILINFLSLEKYLEIRNILKFGKYVEIGKKLEVWKKLEIWKEFGNSEKKLETSGKIWKLGKNENLEKLWKFGKKIWKFDEKLLKFRKCFEIWKKKTWQFWQMLKFVKKNLNLEKIWTFGKALEIWERFGNFEKKIRKFGEKILKVGKEL